MSNVILQRRVFGTLIILIGISAGVAVLYSTTWGPWVKSDSVAYFQAAKNLLLGNGLTILQASGDYVPLAHQPPLYSMILALGDLLGCDMLDFSRFLGVTLICATSIALGYAVLILLCDNIAAILISLLFASSPSILHVHSGAMTESLFFFSAFMGIFLVVSYIQDSRKIYFYSAAILLSIAFLSRFTAIAAVIAAGTAITILGHGQIRRRITEAIILSTIALSPLFILRSIFQINLPEANTSVGILTPSLVWSVLEPIRGALVNTTWNWTVLSFLPLQLPYLVKLIILVLVCLVLFMLVIFSSRRERNNDPDFWYQRPSFALLITSAVFIISYVLFFSTSFFFLNLNLDFTSRLSSPFWLGMLLVLLSSYSFIVSEQRGRLLSRVVLLIGSFIFLVPNLVTTPEIVDRLHRIGEGYTSQSWQQSDLICEVEVLDSSIPIISNEPNAILFLTGRPAYNIEDVISKEKFEQVERFGDASTDPAEIIFRDKGGALVLFNSIYWQLWPKYGDRTQDRLESLINGLYLYTEGHDGAIYFYNRSTYEVPAQ